MSCTTSASIPASIMAICTRPMSTLTYWLGLGTSIIHSPMPSPWASSSTERRSSWLAISAEAICRRWM